MIDLARQMAGEVADPETKALLNRLAVMVEERRASGWSAEWDRVNVWDFRAVWAKTLLRVCPPDPPLEGPDLLREVIRIFADQLTVDPNEL